MKPVFFLYRDSRFEQQHHTVESIEGKLEVGRVDLLKIWATLRENSEDLMDWLQADLENKIVVIDQDPETQELFRIYAERILDISVDRLVFMSGKENVLQIEAMLDSGQLVPHKFTVIGRNYLQNELLTLEEFLEWVLFPTIYHES